MPAMMPAVVLSEPKGPEAAQLVEVERPEPAAGEVRVALGAGSLNHREIWISRGMYPGMALPCVLGADGAGTIDAVGEGVDPARIGEEVLLYPGRSWGASEDWPSDGFCLLGMPLPGTLAGAICVPADLVAPKPAHLDFAQAAALPTAALTAWRALFVKAGLKAGDRVLITGIGGGVAMMALLFAAAIGAKVWVTSGDQANIDRAVDLGAQGGFNYREDGWGKAARKASGGFDVVIDGAPTGAYSGYHRALAMGARVVVYGSTGGPDFKVDAPTLFLRHATLLGTAMGSPKDFGQMVAFVQDKGIVPVIEAVLPMGEVAGAFARLTGPHFGKVVLTVEETDA